MIHEEATGEHVPTGRHHHSKIGSAVSTVLNKLNTWFLDGPKIRSFHSNHMELIALEAEDLEERKKFAKVI